MNELLSFQRAHQDMISHGESLYIDLANMSGVAPLDAILNCACCLESPWNEPEFFFNALGNDDILAISEARSHFNMDPFE